MGEVYRARDTRLQRQVAIKILPSESVADPQFRERFDREARAVAALSHPNIVAIYDVGTHDEAPYAAIELLNGETLRARIARRRSRCAPRSTTRCRSHAGSPPRTAAGSSIGI
jgi:serine/threonine protein kinase